MKKSAKVIHLRVSVGQNDKRTMDEFRQSLVDSLETYANPKNVTITGMQHLHEGQVYSLPEWEKINRVTENIKAEEQEPVSGSVVSLDEVTKERGTNASS